MGDHKEYEKCLILFSSNKYDQCVDKAIEIINAGSAHQSIFQMLLISLQRLGQNEDLKCIATEMVGQTADIPWLRSLLRLTLGQLEPEDMLIMAKSPTQRCEVLYYSGARLKTLGRHQEAEMMFRECVETGVETIEMVLARMELAQRD